MATYHALAAVGESVIGLLAGACPRDEFPTARFEIFQAANLQTGMDEGISLYLTRVAVNGALRNMPARLGPDGQRYKPSLPLDLFFLLTAWAKRGTMQLRLLGWAMRTLEDTPILPAGLLNHYMPEETTFAPAETVELTIEQMSLQDLNNIWQVAPTNQQPSVLYVARLVLLDSELKPSEFPLVQTRELDFAKVNRG